MFALEQLETAMFYFAGVKSFNHFISRLMISFYVLYNNFAIVGRSMLVCCPWCTGAFQTKDCSSEMQEKLLDHCPVTQMQTPRAQLGHILIISLD